MRYLGLALYAEGKSDYLFLGPLLLRLCEQLCDQWADEPIEIGSVVGIDADHRTPARKPDREDRIIEAIKKVPEASILFVHSDAGNDRSKAIENCIEPARRLLSEKAGDPDRLKRRIVAVVPVRESEAWILSDGDAWRKATGSTLGNEDLPFPLKPQEVERIADPKSVLNQTLDIIDNRRGRRRIQAADYFTIVGQAINLEKLGRIPAFRALSEELIGALRDLRFLPQSEGRQIKAPASLPPPPKL